MRRWNAKEKWSRETTHALDRSNRDRGRRGRWKNSTDESVSECLNVCSLPEAARLGNPSGRWAVKKSTTPSWCSLPTFIVYSRSLSESDILASIHISSFQNYVSINVGKNGKLPLNHLMVHSKRFTRKKAVQHIRESYRTQEWLLKENNNRVSNVMSSMLGFIIRSSMRLLSCCTEKEHILELKLFLEGIISKVLQEDMMCHPGPWQTFC